MATPISTIPTLRPDLASFFEFDLEVQKRGYIATRVAPVVETSLQSDNPGKIPLRELLKEADTRRNDRGTYNRGTMRFDKFTYATEENGWEEVIDSREMKRYQFLIDAEQVAAMRALDIVLRNQEKRVASLLFNTSTWTGASLATSVSQEWDKPSNGLPITDVEAAVKKVYEGSGLWANALIINRQVFRNLRNNNQVIDRIESSGAGNAAKPSDITEQMLARVFDLDFVIVAGSSKNNSNEGQNASPVQIWSGEYAMVARVAVTSDMREPCVARTFHWSEDGSAIGGAIDEYEEPQSRGKVIRVRHDTDEVVMYPQAAHLLSNITT